MLHSDLSRIWVDYPEDMLTWLVRLTEEFDLTFPIPDEHCNIVPCLLPVEKPEVGKFDIFGGGGEMVKENVRNIFSCSTAGQVLRTTRLGVKRRCIILSTTFQLASSTESKSGSINSQIAPLSGRKAQNSLRTGIMRSYYMLGSYNTQAL